MACLYTAGSQTRELTILLVDDSPLALQTIGEFLESLEQVGLVVPATGGYEALQLIPQVHPHLALVDIHMPGINGLETCVEILARFPGVAVVLMSANGAEFRTA